MKEKMDSEKQGFSTKNKLPDSYLTSFPLFLKQDKAVPARRVENSHVKAVMGQALNRYEDELNNIKNERKKEAKLKLIQEELSKEQIDLRKQEFEKAAQDHKTYIIEQIENNVLFYIENQKRTRKKLRNKSNKNKFRT